jgi:2-dehydropantoate 2-reductase
MSGSAEIRGLGGTAVAVLGPGAVGGALAVRLAQAGADVVCIARRDTAEDIRSKGLTLRHGSGAVTVQPRALERLEEPVERLFITVKAPALADALGRIGADPNLIVPLLNGIEHVEAIRARLGSRVVAGTVGRLEAYRESPTEIVQTTPAMAVTLASDIDDETAELLRGVGVEVQVDGSERAVLWEKLVRQAALAATTALTQRSLGELRTDPEWRPRLEEAVVEACAVAEADGVDLRPSAQWEIIDALPSTLTTSTARDVAAGRPSELDAITGAVVRAGRRLGVETPTLERLLHEAEERCRAPLR